MAPRSSAEATRARIARLERARHPDDDELRDLLSETEHRISVLEVRGDLIARAAKANATKLSRATAGEKLVFGGTIVTALLSAVTGITVAVIGAAPDASAGSATPTSSNICVVADRNVNDVIRIGVRQTERLEGINSEQVDAVCGDEAEIAADILATRKANNETTGTW